MAKAGYTSGAKSPSVVPHQTFQPGAHITKTLGANPVQRSGALMAQRHTYQVTNSMRQSVSSSLKSGRNIP